MIWLSKETAFLQKSEHVTGSLAEPWNGFLALQLPEAGNLQIFITHFLGHIRTFSIHICPITKCLWASMSSGWLAPRAESLASHRQWPRQPVRGQLTADPQTAAFPNCSAPLQKIKQNLKISRSLQFVKLVNSAKEVSVWTFPDLHSVGMVVPQLVIPGILNYASLRLAQLI